MKKPAPVAHPIHELLVDRYSPRAFTDTPVTEDELYSLLEAARWAASCFNEQPWRYIVAMKSQRERFERLLSCLVEFNQSWAKHASVLMISVAAARFAKNDKPNHHAWHDVGQATASMALQATALGLQIHQMAGFDSDRARDLFAIPDGHEPVAAIAIGRPGDPDLLPEALRERERAERTRTPAAEIAFGDTWGAPYKDA